MKHKMLNEMMIHKYTSQVNTKVKNKKKKKKKTKTKNKIKSNRRNCETVS